MNRSEVAAYLLREGYSPSWKALEDLLPHLEGYRYTFLDPTEYSALLARDTAAGMAVYWREMLHRAHWAASTSLIRTHRWLAGLLDAFGTENLIVFCACTRGLLEASADSWYSLNPVAPTLASAKSIIVKALAERLNDRVLAEEVENRLIHFTFARKAKKGEVLPEHHEAETIAAYLTAFQEEQPSIRNFYAALCDVVHPGARSILSFAKPLDANASNIMLTLEGESRALAEFAVLFRVVLGDIMAAGFNTGILILRTLNALPATEVHTRFLESIPFKPLAAWDTIESLLNA
jgi:hypothetical protein